MASQQNSPRQCTRAELLADAVVHLLGLSFGLAACITLIVFIAINPDLPRGLSLGIYGFGLLAMLACSALYNMTTQARLKAMFRRFDHAAIFVMIAGTYTPFSLIVIGGLWGALLLGFVWSVALLGVFLKLRYPLRFEKLSVVAYLLLGWVIVAALQPLISSMSLAALPECDLACLRAVGGRLSLRRHPAGCGDRLRHQAPRARNGRLRKSGLP
jgi:hemolysin III